jgi:hypothetical protein
MLKIGVYIFQERLDAAGGVNDKRTPLAPVLPRSTGVSEDVAGTGLLPTQLKAQTDITE